MDQPLQPRPALGFSFDISEMGLISTMELSLGRAVMGLALLCSIQQLRYSQEMSHLEFFQAIVQGVELMVLTRSLGQAWFLVLRGSPVVCKKVAACFVGQLLEWRAECCWGRFWDSQCTLAEWLRELVGRASQHGGNNGLGASVSFPFPRATPQKWSLWAGESL